MNKRLRAVTIVSRIAAVFCAIAGIFWALAAIWFISKFGNNMFILFFLSESFIGFILSYGFWKLQRWAITLLAANIAVSLVIPIVFGMKAASFLGFASWLFIKTALLAFVYVNRNHFAGKYVSEMPVYLSAVLYVVILVMLYSVKFAVAK